MVLLAAALLVGVPVAVRHRPTGPVAQPLPAELVSRVQASAAVGWSGRAQSRGSLQLPDNESFATLGQLLGQGQDLITAVTLAAAIVVFLPWLVVLLVLALVPAFLNELHFNRRGYRLAFSRSPERRELDYLRYLGAGAVLTGGCSLVHGVNHLAEEILGLPVQPAQPPPLQGVTAALANPQLSTALGLIKYAQFAQMERPETTFWSRLRGKLFGGGRRAN